VSSEVGVEFPVEVFDELGPGYVGPGTLGLWSACAQGTHYVSVLDLGARSPFLAPVNRYLSTRAFPERMARAWVVHNVEEVGVLEHLLRDILRQRPDVVGLAR